MKKLTNILAIVFFACFCSVAQAQWPVNGGSQGTITGTIGEVRGGGQRIHNGTDVDFPDEKVYAIQADRIATIGGSGNLRYIEMKSGIRYTHVTPLASIAKNQKEIEEINKGKKIVDVAAKQHFAQMIPSNNGFGSHVHLSISNRQNYLPSGFGVAGYTFADAVVPKIGEEGLSNSSAIKVYADGKAGESVEEFDGSYWDAQTNTVYTKIWGSVDITANAYQNWINAAGGNVGSGHLAPFTLGYGLKKRGSTTYLIENWDRIKFDFGAAGDGVNVTNQQIIGTIHASNSTSDNPFWTVTNRYQNSVATDEKLKTDDYEDGDYQITVKAQGAPAPSMSKERTLDVRIDNFKAYVKKVVVANSEGTVKYFAEWSSIKQGSDGSILIVERNSESFTGGETVKIDVTTSEPVTALLLYLPGMPSVPLQKIGTDGTQWSVEATLPGTTDKTKSYKVPLGFESDDEIYGLELNQDYANVKRKPNYDYADSKSIDYNHELKVCPNDYDLKLEVEVKDNTTAILSATGGTTPYEFSMDEAPFKPNNKSAFSPTNQFTIDYEKNYLFKVRDQEGCQSEEYYTLEKVACNETAFAGGEGTDIKQVNLGTQPGTVRIAYDMYGIPDQITVEYHGTSQTTGIVSGPGEITFEHTPKKGESNLVTITMYAPNPGTAWEYTVYCPVGSSQTFAKKVNSEEQEGKDYKLTYSPDGIEIISSSNNGSETYDINYRPVGGGKWEVIRNASLPLKLNNGGKDLQVKITPSAGTRPAGSLRVFPNPSTGPVTIEYLSDKAGVVILGITNADGKSLYEKQVFVSKGLNILTWQRHDDVEGMLMVNIKDAGKTQSAKVLIRK